MPNLVARHRQTTMTQQFGYAEAEEEKGSNDESLPPNWGRFQDPSTGRNASFLFLMTMTLAGRKTATTKMKASGQL